MKHFVCECWVIFLYKKKYMLSAFRRLLCRGFNKPATLTHVQLTAVIKQHLLVGVLWKIFLICLIPDPRSSNSRPQTHLFRPCEDFLAIRWYSWHFVEMACINQVLIMRIIEYGPSPCPTWSKVPFQHFPLPSEPFKIIIISLGSSPMFTIIHIVLL